MIPAAILAVALILLGFYVERRFARPSLDPITANARKRMLPVIQSHGHADFTCDRCAAANECDYAFDPYNTNGDCLAEK